MPFYIKPIGIKVLPIIRPFIGCLDFLPSRILLDDTRSSEIAYGVDLIIHAFLLFKAKEARLKREAAFSAANIKPWNQLTFFTESNIFTVLMYSVNMLIFGAKDSWVTQSGAGMITMSYVSETLLQPPHSLVFCAKNILLVHNINCDILTCHTG